ncbi:MAG: IS607 family transposase [Desulfobacterales bacterium]|nr:IS607 family transposase [Desulfobacterales bacterium]
MKVKKLTPKQAAEYFSVNVHTLRVWDKEGKIKTERTPGGDRRYLIEISEEYHICYCRVSSDKQKDDLEQQVNFMQEKYPNADIVKDIGSGLNFRRKGLKTILERTIKGDCITLYIAHKDRLCRFGYDLIEWIIKRSGGNIVVLDKTVMSPESELIRDLLYILHIFSRRMHGLRDYRRQVGKALSDGGTEKDVQDTE